MEADTVIITIFGAILSLAVALLLVKVNRIEKKADKRHQESIEREVLLCNHRLDEADLVLETAKAVKEGKANGRLDKAMTRFEKTHQEYEKFVSIQAGTRLAENR